MFIHDFNPILADIGPVSIRWYSLAYIFGILLGLYYGKHLIRQLSTKIKVSEKNLDDYLVWAVIGIVLGGRIGYVFFYNSTYYFDNPSEILKIWNGGMSFHGGLIGIILSSLLFSKKNNISFWSLTDLLACISPIGIFFGRIANFINAELVGKASSLPWSFIFPQYDQLPRHPSQIYEALLEGLSLFIIMNLLLRKTNMPTGYLSILFLILYSTFRMIGEIFREPDQQLGYLFFGMSMGSILSAITITLASIFVLFFNKK